MRALIATGSFIVGPRRLAMGQAGGRLGSMTFAAKEVFDVAGLVTGAGSPVRRAEMPAAERHAWIVDALLRAGADLMGTTVTDELAFSLSGTNVHDGTPRHPIDAARVPGGSSAGSASAVAHGLVDIGLGTDTGGSIRVPASYCGLVGLRPTHGRIPVDGIVPLAPSFDAVGLLTRDADTMAAAWSATVASLPVPEPAPEPRELFIADDLFTRLDAVVRRDVGRQLLERAEHIAHHHGLIVRHGTLAGIVGVGLEALLDAFRVLQMREVWTAHGRWITDRQPPMGPGIAARFEAARAITDEQVLAARPVMATCRTRLRAMAAEGTIVVQPAASGPAPPIDQDGAAKHTMRADTLVLTTPAGLAGLPVLVIPGAMSNHLPIGLAMVGAVDGETRLIRLAQLDE